MLIKKLIFRLFLPPLLFISPLLLMMRNSLIREPVIDLTLTVYPCRILILTYPVFHVLTLLIHSSFLICLKLRVFSVYLILPVCIGHPWFSRWPALFRAGYYGNSPATDSNYHTSYEQKCNSPG